MRTLHRYLLRQILATLLLTVAVFTFVLLLGNVLRDVLPLLMSQTATFGAVLQAFGLLIPFVGVYALPMGLLTATLLVFGRFSADQEYTAARASGIGLISLATPILVLSLVLSALSAVVNLDAGPRSRVAFKQLKDKLMANIAMIQLPEGRPIEFKAKTDDLNSESPVAYTISVGRNRRQTLEDVRLFRVVNETNLEMMVNAPRGKVEMDQSKGAVILQLFDAQIIYVANELPISSDIEIRLDLRSAKESKPGITDLTFSQLRGELKNLENRLGLPLQQTIPPGPQVSAQRAAVKKQVSDMAQPYRVQIHRRVAFSFACFGFALIGIPLGIRVHRRETNIGIAIALLLVAVYYGLLIVAESLTHRPEFAPHLLVWIPNFVFQAIGAVLLWRANRGV
ncbi:MAG TPA: LptF/LptG family permease [Verrucomicrobiae bacterium]|nr:LptF/LptG family permease [Verrucomicrobiae bacterium]